jgi:biotin carboxylase
MSVIIIGGHDRMHRNYIDICREFGCEATVCTQPSRRIESMVERADIAVLFTNPISHEMAKMARSAAQRCGKQLFQSHSASGAALRGILAEGGGVRT